MTRPLGDTQLHVLWSMVSHGRDGVWTPFCGWYYETRSRTERIMESLRLRGLVSELDRYTTQGGRKVRYTQYKITDAGREAAGDPNILPARRHR
jgi:hypothetical protein